MNLNTIGGLPQILIAIICLLAMLEMQAAEASGVWIKEEGAAKEVQHVAQLKLVPKVKYAVSMGKPQVKTSVFPLSRQGSF